MHNIDGSGFISALDFADIMLSTKSHLLTSSVQENLVAVSSVGGGEMRGVVVRVLGWLC